MLTSQFAFKAPETIEELLSEIDANPDAAILSGGHTLIGLLKSEAIDPDIIISTEKIQGLKEIKQESDGSVVIGSSVTLSALLDNSSVGAKFPSLKEVIRNIGDRQYCNQTSIGDEFSYKGNSIGVLAVLLAHAAEFCFCKGKDIVKVVDPTDKPNQSILTSIKLNPSKGSTHVREIKDPISRLPLCGIAIQIEGNKKAIQPTNFIVYGQNIAPTRLITIENLIKEADRPENIQKEKIGKAISEAVQNSPANPDYVTNLVYTFIKRVISSVG